MNHEVLNGATTPEYEPHSPYRRVIEYAAAGDVRSSYAVGYKKPGDVIDIPRESLRANQGDYLGYAGGPLFRITLKNGNQYFVSTDREQVAAVGEDGLRVFDWKEGSELNEITIGEPTEVGGYSLGGPLGEAPPVSSVLLLAANKKPEGDQDLRYAPEHTNPFFGDEVMEWLASEPRS